MRSNIVILSIAIGFSALLGLASSASAQRVGGYKDVDKASADVQNAAEFAVSAQAEKSGKELELVTVLKAERQVVAGSNFRLCIKVNSEGADEAQMTVLVVVYVDLKGNKKLTSWAASDCDPDGN